MKKLVFAALMIGGLMQATGCIISSDDDDDVDGMFNISWSLTSAAGGTCADSGVTDIWSYALLDGAVDPIIDKFDCIDASHMTAPLPVGSYTVWVNALDASENLVAQSFSERATLLGGDMVSLSFTFPTDMGNLALTWSLTDDTNTLTCAEVVAGGVSVVSTPVGSGGTFFDDIFDCTDGEGVTDPLAIDAYTVVVTILEEGTDAVLGESDPRSTSIDYGNHQVDLGNFEFVFAPQ